MILERQLHLNTHSSYLSITLSCIMVLMCHDAGCGDDDHHHHHDNDVDARFVGNQGVSRLVDCITHTYTKVARTSE